MTTNEALQIGDRVQVCLNQRFGEQMGWYDGVVVRIESYSDHRSFYWVLLDTEAQSVLKIREISVLNPKNIRKVD